MQSIITKHNDSLVVSLKKVSDELSADITSMQKLIREHKNELELFGNIEFEYQIVKGRTGSTKKKLYYLNEQQSYLFITFLKNTKIVKEFKIKLIQEFFRMKQELSVTAAPTQLDLITPYEVRRDLATTRRKLTIEKKKHRATAELYEQARKERDRLKLELVRVNDTLHAVMQRDLSKADIALVLYQLTNSFQTLPSIAKDGQNLNTDTKAGLEYWGEKYKPLIDEARDFENRLKNKMKQQLKLIVSSIVTNTERDIVNRFEESLEVNARAIKLPYRKTSNSQK